MRDLIAEMQGASYPNTTGTRDLIAEMGGGIPAPISPEEDELSWWEKALSSIGSGFQEEAKAQGSAGRIAAATAGGLLTMPVAGMAGLAKTITSGIDEGGKTLEGISSLPGRLIQSPEEAYIMEQTVGTAMKPFQMAGEGLKEIVRLTPAKDTIAEPIAGAIGEISAMFGLPGVPKAAKSWWNNLPYRKRLMVVEQVQADIANGEFTGAELRELWKDPANREALLKRYQGVGDEKPTGPTIRTSGADIQGELPAGQGFEMRPRPGEVRDIIAEMGAEGPKALPAGQGFELRPTAAEIRDLVAEMQKPGAAALPYPEGVGEGFVSRPGDVEAPIVTKAGEPFKTEQTATRAGKGLDWNLYEVTPLEDGYAITRKVGREIRPESARPQMVLRGTEMVEAGTPQTPQVERMPAETGNVPPAPEIVQPRPKSPEGIIGRINQLGGLNVYDDYNAPELRQFPDMARVMKKAGVKPDEAAMQLNDDGFVTPTGEPFTGDSLVEYLKAGQARDILTPGKAESIFERQKLIGSQRGSTGPINESEILSAILKTRGKIEQAMPHLEALGRSVYEGGKTRFLDWQAAIKTKLGDLWESFKAHLKGIFDRLQSGKIGPLKNQKGAVGADINKGRIPEDLLGEMAEPEKGPVIKQREIKDAKTGQIRQAPAVHLKEFEAVKNMPELRRKPLGGWLETPIRTFEELGPEIKELFYRPIKEAEHLARLHFKKIHEKAESIRKSLPGKSSERIGTYAIAQQKDGMKILESMGIKDIPKLTPEEMKAYNWMRNGLETFYNKLQEARAKAGKEGFGHVENYFTFARQFDLLEKLGFSPIFSRLELLQNVMHRKTTPFQYEKHRVGGLTKADLDAFGIFNRYMESATRHYYLSPAIAKGREMLLTFHEGDAKWILRNEKPEAAKFITEWLDFQAGQRKPQLPNLIEKGLTKLNKNLAFSILSANIRSALIQPTALLNTAAEIGPKWTAAGVKSLFDASSMEKSNVLLSRQFDINVTESLAGLPGKIGKAKQAAGNIGMKPLQFLDIQTAKATWQGAYKKAKSEGMQERQAINYADDVVTKTQGSAMPSDLSPAQRTALGKALTMFQTFVINQWGFLTRDVLGIKNPAVKTPQAVKKVLTFTIGATLINSFYEDVLGLPSPLPSPISAFVKALEEGEELPSASLDAAAEIASLVPVVGGGIRYGSSMLGAPAEYVGDIGKKLAPNYVGPTRSTAELVAKGLGVPGTAQLVKSLRIANKGGSPVDVILGRYPEKSSGGKLVNPKLKGLKSGQLKGLK